jgi:hypothetical protein
MIAAESLHVLSGVRNAGGQRVGRVTGVGRAVGVDDQQGLPTAITVDWRPDRVTVAIELDHVVDVFGIC